MFFCIVQVISSMSSQCFYISSHGIRSTTMYHVLFPLLTNVWCEINMNEWMTDFYAETSSRRVPWNCLGRHVNSSYLPLKSEAGHHEACHITRVRFSWAPFRYHVTIWLLLSRHVLFPHQEIVLLIAWHTLKNPSRFNRGISTVIDIPKTNKNVSRASLEHCLTLLAPG